MKSLSDRRPGTVWSFVLVAAAVTLCGVAGFAAAPPMPPRPPAMPPPPPPPRVPLLNQHTGTVVDAGSVAPNQIVTLRPGTVQGTVSAPSGVPLGGARVALVSPVTGKTTMQGSTDSKGHYELPNVPEGTHVALAGTPGVATVLKVSKDAPLPVLTAVNIVVPAAANTSSPLPPPEGGTPPPVLGSVGVANGAATVTGGVLLPGRSVSAVSSMSVGVPPPLVAPSADPPPPCPPPPPEPARPGLPPMLSPIMP